MEISSYEIRPSKHFVVGWMKRWDWTTDNVRTAIEIAYKIEKVGNNKYEAYTRHGSGNKNRKIIFIKDDDIKVVFMITGAEGK